MEATIRKRLARTVWPRYSQEMDILNRNAQMWAYLRTQDSPAVHHELNGRLGLYGYLSGLLGNVSICYLEFGVWKGESLREWARLNTNPASRFYGFDSFEGLPEVWSHGFGNSTGKEYFSLNGNHPTFTDVRVDLRKGWFQETLRPFLAAEEIVRPLVVHNDSDLHSSTLYTLATLDPFLQAGDVVIFDEYTSPINEHLAWQEYQQAFMRKSRCIARTDHWAQVAFMLL